MDEALSLQINSRVHVLPVRVSLQYWLGRLAVCSILATRALIISAHIQYIHLSLFILERFRSGIATSRLCAIVLVPRNAAKKL